MCASSLHGNREISGLTSRRMGWPALGRFLTGPNIGDWFVVVRYANQSAYENAQAAIAEDPECQWAFAEIAKFATRISRELVTDLDL